MPVRPLCHGAWCFWPGSQGLSRNRGMRFLVKLGILLRSSGWIQPRPIIRAAIQSVITIMSRLIDWQDASWFFTLA